VLGGVTEDMDGLVIYNVAGTRSVWSGWSLIDVERVLGIEGFK